jgi:hypothetical protein
MRISFVKRSTSSDNVLLFLIAATFSVLVTRFGLEALGYPQIARGSIHLAHAIYGGALLSIANILLLTLHGRRVRQTAAVIAGLGFGQFIDEVGKFITRDNNYFYQPVPMIIYVSFISIFLIYRYFDRYTPLRPKEIIYDVLEHLEELAEGNLHEPSQKWIEQALERIVQRSKKNYEIFAHQVLHIVRTIDISKKPSRSYVQKIQSSWQWLDEFTTERRPVFYFLLFVFLAYIATTLLSTFTFSQVIWYRQFENLKYKVDTRFEIGLVTAQFISQFVSALLMIRGFIYLISRKKIKALEFFRNGLAVNILITHVFTFYFKQFDAVPELLITILMFAIVHNILEEARS